MRFDSRHRNRTGVAIAAAVYLGFSCAPAYSQEKVVHLLERQTQALLNAVSAGDAAVWDRYVDAQIVYLSEEGTRKTKADLLTELKPLPTGMSGSLKVSSFQARVHGMTAVTTHDDLEALNYFGHALTAEYRTTDTWISTAAGWRLVASQVHAQLFDPPAIRLPASKLDEYVGLYRLNADIAYMIRREGDALVGERSGRMPQHLSVEVADVMFVPGRPRDRKVFLRTAEGRISGFVDRRGGRDVPWHRVD